MRSDSDTNIPERFSKKFSNNEILKALIVGETTQGSSYLVKRLGERGCKCEFATSYEEANWLLRTENFCLVLSPTTLRARNLLPLMDLLEGSNASLFYAHLVELGCWWLPALRCGHKCFGSNALRPSEFVSVLDETIEEVRGTGQMDYMKPRT